MRPTQQLSNRISDGPSGPKPERIGSCRLEHTRVNDVLGEARDEPSENVEIRITIQLRRSDIDETVLGVKWLDFHVTPDGRANEVNWTEGVFFEEA